MVKISVGNTPLRVQRSQRLVSIVTSSAHCAALAHTWSRKKTQTPVRSAEKYGHLATRTGTLRRRWWEEGAGGTRRPFFSLHAFVIWSSSSPLHFLPVTRRTLPEKTRGGRITVLHFTLVNVHLSSLRLIRRSERVNRREFWSRGTWPRESRRFKRHETNIRAEKKGKKDGEVCVVRQMPGEWERRSGEAPLFLSSVKSLLLNL